MVISTVAVLIICGLIFWLKRDTKKETAILKAKAKTEEQKAAEEKIAATIAVEEKNWLEKVGELFHGSDSAAFYNELNFALKSYLSKKLNLPIGTINKKNINEELDKKNIAVNTAVQLQQLMNDIELQLYTPFAEKDKMEQLYNNTADIIQMLDTYKV